MGKTEPGYRIYQNPVMNRKLNRRLTEMEKGNFALSIYSSSGQLVHSRMLYHTGGSSVIQLDLDQSMKSGRYRIVFIKPDGTKLERVVVVMR